MNGVFGVDVAGDAGGGVAFAVVVEGDVEVGDDVEGIIAVLVVGGGIAVDAVIVVLVVDSGIVDTFGGDLNVVGIKDFCYSLFRSIVLSLLIQTYPRRVSNYLRIICTTGPFIPLVYSHARTCKCLSDLPVI